MNRRDFIGMVVAFVAGCSAEHEDRGDWRPRRPINLVVPYQAGGGTDGFARAFSQAAKKTIPVPVVVVNRPGSSGIAGAIAAARARPDGTMLLLTSAGSLVLNSLMRDISVNAFDSFRTIAQVGNLTTSVMVSAESSIASFEDLIAKLAGRPGALRWAHTGRGSFHHIAGQGFLDINGLSAQDVPFRGGSATRAAVMGGQVDFGIIGIQQYAGFEQDLRVLGLNARERDPIMSDVPTLAELGHKFVDISSPIVIFAPADLPEAIAQPIEDYVRRIAADPVFAKAMLLRHIAPAYLGAHGAETRLREIESFATPIIDQLAATKQ